MAKLLVLSEKSVQRSLRVISAQFPNIWKKNSDLGEHSNFGVFLRKKKKTNQRTQERRIHKKKIVTVDYRALPHQKEHG